MRIQTIQKQPDKTYDSENLFLTGTVLSVVMQSDHRKSYHS